ncbi:hypothetical protein GQ600_24805 [Phytophthora cactorum]|nr:hypothetical protein GQ600_24805 [Phytophthora cactorum]
MRAPQRGMSYRRKRSQIPSSPLLGYSGEECHYPAEGLPPLGLGLGSAESPLLYCKHQAPVPPKDKTPRKLWNAIGGEDRRLIVLQRNHLPPC